MLSLASVPAANAAFTFVFASSTLTSDTFRRLDGASGFAELFAGSLGARSVAPGGANAVVVSACGVSVVGAALVSPPAVDLAWLKTVSLPFPVTRLVAVFVVALLPLIVPVVFCLPVVVPLRGFGALRLRSFRATCTDLVAHCGVNGETHVYIDHFRFTRQAYRQILELRTTVGLMTGVIPLYLLQPVRVSPNPAFP